MKKRLAGTVRVFLAMPVLILLTSCALFDWFGAKVHDDEVTDLDNDLGTPDSRITAYESSLKRFGRMLEAYDLQNLRVQSKLISNETADHSLPRSISKMMATSINKIGKKVVYLPYDPNYVINEASTGGDISRSLPQVVVAGGITEFDKGMIEKSRELKTDVKIEKGQWGSKHDMDGGAGYQAVGSVSRITLDLHLLDYKTQSSIAGAQASNTILLRRTSLGWGVGAFFQGCGLTFDYELRKKQGKYYALRLLAELSTLEVLGRFYDVPYWRCIPNAKPDQSMLNRLREEFGELSEEEQLAYLREYLFFHGASVNRGGDLTQQDLLSIKKAMAQKKTPTYTDLFMNLWQTVPIESARRRVRNYNRIASQQQQQAQLQAQQAAQEAQQQAQQQKQAQQQQAAAEAAKRQAEAQAQKQKAAQPAPAPKKTKKTGKEAPIGFGPTEW